MDFEAQFGIVALMQPPTFVEADTVEVDLAKPVAVIDSNVLLETVSCIDLFKHYARNDIDQYSQNAILRRQRARESLLLSIHLDRVKATTFSIFEAIRITEREVDPNERHKFEYHAITIWAHFVKDHVLPNWTMNVPSNGDDEPRGNQADALLVEHAKKLGIPLISHEGVTTTGVDYKCWIRRKARKAGVAIVTPREFYGRVDELLYSALFLQRFDGGSAEYVRASPQSEVTRESVDLLRGYYMHILYGTTNGEREPLPIRLSSTGVGLTVEQCMAENGD